MSGNRYYSVRVDGIEVDALELTYEQYQNQAARDRVRNEVAERLNVSTWGLRLQEINRPYIVYTDFKTKKQIRKYVQGKEQ